MAWARPGRIVAAFVSCVVAGTPALGADATASKEQQLRAAFVYHFTKFIEWPAASFRGHTDALVIGTFCDEPLSAELERVVEGRSVNGRTVTVRRLYSAHAAAAVHLVYVCAEESVRFGRIREAVGDLPVVTVGETESIARLGGMIVLVQAGNRLRFDIDADSAERAGIRISSQLLKLARRVRGP